MNEITKTIKNNHLLGSIICSLAAIFYCYEFLLRIEPSVMVPELMKAFNVDATHIGLLSAFYYFVYAPMQIGVGVLSDVYGPRRVLTAAVFSCAIGSLIFGNAHGFALAAVGRLMVGFGSAFAFVGILKLASSWLPHRFFALFVGMTTALGMAGAIVGDVSLTAFVKSVGWKETISYGTIFGFALVPIFWLVVRDAPAAVLTERKDIPSSVRYRETFLGFLRLIKNSQVWLGGAIGCILYLSLSLFAELWAIPFLKNVYGLSAHSAASACSMVFLGWLIGGPLAGLISDHTKSRKWPLLIGCILGGIIVTIIIYYTQLSGFWLYSLLFLFGLCSSAQVLCFAVSRDHCPKQIVATAMAFTNFIVMISGIIFQPLFGRLLDRVWTGQIEQGIRVYAAADYQHAMIILPIAYLIGLVLILWLRDSKECIS